MHCSGLLGSRYRRLPEQEPKFLAIRMLSWFDLRTNSQLSITSQPNILPSSSQEGGSIAYTFLSRQRWPLHVRIRVLVAIRWNRQLCPPEFDHPGYRQYWTAQ